MIGTAVGIWLAAGLLSVWAGGRNGLAWAYLGALSGTVAGTAFAASGLGLVTQRWQHREFLRRGRSIAHMTLDLIELRLGEVARLGVATIEPAFPLLQLYHLDVGQAVHIPCSDAHISLVNAAKDDARRVEGVLGRARFDVESEIERSQNPPLTPTPPPELEQYEVPDIPAEEILAVARAIREAADQPSFTDACGMLSRALADLGPYLDVDDLVWGITERASELTNLAAQSSHNRRTTLAGSDERDHVESPGLNSLKTEKHILAAAENQARVVQGLLSLVGDLLRDLSSASEDVARRPRWRAPWEPIWAKKTLDRLAAVEDKRRMVDVGVPFIEIGLCTKQQIESGRAMRRASDAHRLWTRRRSQAGQARKDGDEALACLIYGECDKAGVLDAVGLLEYAQALAAKPDEDACLVAAQRSLKTARTERPELLCSSWFAFLLSRCFAINGDAEQVVTLLREVTDEEWLSHLPQVVETDAAFDRIRSEPALVAFLQEVAPEVRGLGNERSGRGTAE